MSFGGEIHRAGPIESEESWSGKILPRYLGAIPIFLVSFVR